MFFNSWYKGIYFNSNIDYALTFGDMLIVSCVIPGNAFPVIESPFKPSSPKQTNSLEINPNSFYGKGVKGAYQSHYTLGKILTFV